MMNVWKVMEEEWQGMQCDSFWIQEHSNSIFEWGASTLNVYDWKRFIAFNFVVSTAQHGEDRLGCCVSCSWCHCSHEAFLFCCLSSLLVFGRSSAFVSCERQSHVAVCVKLSGVTWWEDFRCVSSPPFSDTWCNARLCGQSTTCDLMFDRRSLEELSVKAQKFIERSISCVS